MARNAANVQSQFDRLFAEMTARRSGSAPVSAAPPRPAPAAPAPVARPVAVASLAVAPAPTPPPVATSVRPPQSTPPADDEDDEEETVNTIAAPFSFARAPPNPLHDRSARVRRTDMDVVDTQDPTANITQITRPVFTAAPPRPVVLPPVVPMVVTSTTTTSAAPTKPTRPLIFGDTQDDAKNKDDDEDTRLSGEDGAQFSWVSKRFARRVSKTSGRFSGMTEYMRRGQQKGFVHLKFDTLRNYTAIPSRSKWFPVPPVKGKRAPTVPPQPWCLRRNLGARRRQVDTRRPAPAAPPPPPPVRSSSQLPAVSIDIPPAPSMTGKRTRHSSDSEDSSEPDTRWMERPANKKKRAAAAPASKAPAPVPVPAAGVPPKRPVGRPPKPKPPQPLAAPVPAPPAPVERRVVNHPPPSAAHPTAPPSASSSATASPSRPLPFMDFGPSLQGTVVGGPKTVVYYPKGPIKQYPNRRGRPPRKRPQPSSPPTSGSDPTYKGGGDSERVAYYRRRAAAAAAQAARAATTGTIATSNPEVKSASEPRLTASGKIDQRFRPPSDDELPVDTARSSGGEGAAAEEHASPAPVSSSSTKVAEDFRPPFKPRSRAELVENPEVCANCDGPLEDLTTRVCGKCSARGVHYEHGMLLQMSKKTSRMKRRQAQPQAMADVTGTATESDSAAPMDGVTTTTTADEGSPPEETTTTVVVVARNDIAPPASTMDMPVVHMDTDATEADSAPVQTLTATSDVAPMDTSESNVSAPVHVQDVVALPETPAPVAIEGSAVVAHVTSVDLSAGAYSVEPSDGFLFGGSGGAHNSGLDASEEVANAAEAVLAGLLGPGAQ